MVNEGQLELDGAVKVIEEVTPVLKDCVLVLILCQLIVNIIKADTFGIRLILYPPDAILSHLTVCSGFLHRQPFFLLLFRVIFCLGAAGWLLLWLHGFGSLTLCLFSCLLLQFLSLLFLFLQTLLPLFLFLRLNFLPFQLGL